MSVIISLHDFMSNRHAKLLLDSAEIILKRADKVYLIVDDLPKTKVYCRVFKTKERAEKAIEERDDRTGEMLYPACHVVERIIE